VFPAIVDEFHGQFTKQTLTPNSSQTVFILDNEVASVNSIRVMYGGVPQEPGIAYTVAGDILTFTFTPQTGIITYVIFLNAKVPIGTPGDGTITEAKLDTNAILRRGHFWGLNTGNNSGDATNDIDIGVGECTSEDGTTNIVLSSSMTKRIDATWTAGTGNGGFPSALTLTTDIWYHLFVIKKTSTGVVDVGFDTSLTATNLLNTSTYDKYRRIASVYRNSTPAIELYFQQGDYFYWKDWAWTQITNPADGNVTVSTPTGVRTLGQFHARVNNTNSNPVYALLQATDQTVTGSATLATTGHASTGGGFAHAQIWVMTNTSSQIQNTDSSNGSSIHTIGWRDFRGTE